MNDANMLGEGEPQDLQDEVLHRVLGGAGVKAQRQLKQGEFQNFDQKTGQVYQTLSNVLKALAEMRGASVRNVL